MPLLAYNKTASPITLTQAQPAVILPASAAPPARGKAYDVTAELWPNATVDPANGRTGGLDGAAFTALSAYPNVDFIWTHGTEYLTGALAPAGPSPGPHSHTAASTTAVNGATTTTNQAATATNQNATATNQNATATNQAATATNQSTVAAQLVNLGAPAAPDAAGVHAAFAGNDAALAFPGPFTNPDVPRSLVYVFGLGYDGGDLVVTGTDYLDQVLVENVTAVADSTVYGTAPFKTVTGATKAAVGSNPATVSIGRGQRLGLGAAISGNFGVLTADGITEVGLFSATYNTVNPTTPPDASTEFVALVNRVVTPLQNSHNHTQDAHTHTQDAHAHTQDAHNHTQDSHNHTQTGHGHSVA